MELFAFQRLLPLFFPTMFSFTSHPSLGTRKRVTFRNRCFHGVAVKLPSSPLSRKYLHCVAQHGFPDPDNRLETESSLSGLLDGSEDFGRTVDLLKNRFGTLPQTDDPISKAISQGDIDREIKPEEFFSAIVDNGVSPNESTEELSLGDEHAISSLLVDDDVLVPSTSVQGTADLASITAAVESLWRSENIGVGSSQTISHSIGHLSNAEPLQTSRTGKSKDMKAQMDAVKRRRQSLHVKDDGAPSNHMLDEYGPIDTTAPIADVLSNVGRQQIKNMFAFSLSQSRVVDFSKASVSPRGGALTTCAERLMQEVSRFPLSFRPFHGMLQAFGTLDMTPCPRCGILSSRWTIEDTNELCQDCYRKIFLQNEPISSAGELAFQDKDTRAEKKRHEERSTAEAIALSKMLLSRSSTDDFSMKDASVKMQASTNEGQSIAPPGSKSSTDVFTQNLNNGATGNNGDGSPPKPQPSQRGDKWDVQASERSMRTINPIRNLIQNMKVEPNPDKELIKLSVGDPTVYGNLKVSKRAVERYCECIRSFDANGYAMSMGSVEARTAVANRYSTIDAPLSATDVFLAGGASGALELAIGAIANEGDNLLLPRPGFPLFVTIAQNYGIECRYYRVNPERNWEIELNDLIELADSRTAAIVVNNPSNPCGSVYSASHIEDLLATAAAIKVPVIADEVYADMVFSGTSFTSVGSKSSDVPVLCVGAISKQFVVPGWRVGWVLMHDRQGIFEAGNIPQALRQLTTRMLVANTPAQAVLPTLLQDGIRDRAFRAVMKELEENARFTVQALSTAKGLRVIEPQGAMYVMAEIDVEMLGLKDDMEFTEKLMEEESVFVLPGQCFQAANFVRIVFAAPQAVLSDAFFRIRSFCSRHSGGM